MDKIELLYLIDFCDLNAVSQDYLFSTAIEQLKCLFSYKCGGVLLLNKAAADFVIAYITINSFKEEIIVEGISGIPDSLLQTNKIIIIKTGIIFKQDINDKSKKLFEYLLQQEISELLIAPLRIGDKLIGLLFVSIDDNELIKTNNYDFIQKTANHISLVIYYSLELQKLQKKEYVNGFQLGLIKSLAAIKSEDKLYLKFAAELDKVIPLKYVGINTKFVINSSSKTFSFVKDNNKWIPLFADNALEFSSLYFKTRIQDKASNNIFVFEGEKFRELSLHSNYFSELKNKHEVECITYFFYEDNFENEINLLISLKGSMNLSEIERTLIAQSVIRLLIIRENLVEYEVLVKLKEHLEQENNYLLEEISIPDNGRTLIGKSLVMQNVMNKIRQIANLDVIVLLQGETGTGKELAAREIHNLSHRKDKALVKVNCAALPAQLIESELFGHEKGSFTGATETRIGKFELANGGTLFLDEVGELPFELQSKLLRVLQENEFERIGGCKTIKSNLRIIAATNRELEKEMQAGHFRSDLYFRLNVYPINLPPLRERLEDIPLFVNYFIKHYSKKLGKNVTSIKKSSMLLFEEYNWPGNIRELEHIIERAIINTQLSCLEINNAYFLGHKPVYFESDKFRPLIEIEKEYIIRALVAANGKVTGKNGAADLLKIHGKTLFSKMRKYGIKRSNKFN